MREEHTDRRPDSSLALTRALYFSRFHALLITAISLAVLLPCFWHKHIEAGDLGSHTYNAWLAQLIERGQAPGLYLARQWTNLLVDVALLRLGNIVGFAAAEKIVVSACVLIFFWGTFVLIAAASRQPPWFLVPAIAMIAYGWTFQMGFMNYYLSLGLGFVAAALFWRGRLADYGAACAFMFLALLAHPMGFVCVGAAIIYIKLAESIAGLRRWALFLIALLTLIAVHLYITHQHHFRTQSWDTSVFYLMNGTDQLALFGRPYKILARLAILFAGVCVLHGRFSKNTDMRTRGNLRTPSELWLILLFTAAMIPESIQFSLYRGPAGFMVSRLTSCTAVMGLCIVGGLRPRRWYLAGFVLLAALFFVLMYRDTGTLNKMETKAESLVSTLPYGRRVTETIEPPEVWRIYFINHIVDRACIGHCLTYSNYEPSFGQFRVRVDPRSPIVTDSPETSHAMEMGDYIVQPKDLPMTEIYQCDEKDFAQLCMRNLAAGEKNGGLGYGSPGP